jgi:hypothetical protein
VAGLAGRALPVLPAEALLTSRAHGAGQRTARCLAAAFVHDLTPLFHLPLPKVRSGKECFRTGTSEYDHYRRQSGLASNDFEILGFGFVAGLYRTDIGQTNG